MADFETVHDALDHTGLTGVGGGTEFTESSRVKLTSGDLTTTSTTFTDATGLTATLTTAAVRCLVTFSASVSNSGTAKVSVDLAVDGTRVSGGAYGLGLVGGASTDRYHLAFTYLTDVLTAASHTLKIQWRVDNASTGTMYANTTTAAAVFTVLETSMTA